MQDKGLQQSKHIENMGETNTKLKPTCVVVASYNLI